MQGDFSRDSFEPLRGFSRVLSQQGRLTLDADLNELQSIQLHLLRTLARDLIGPYAGSGFDIGALNDRDFTIAPGHYYVDGFLCENDRPVVYQQRGAGAAANDVREQQPYLAVAQGNDPLSISAAKQYAVYLDVWERHVSFAEADGVNEVTHHYPPLLRDEALGPVDTASRAQVIWQVRIDDLRDVAPAVVVTPRRDITIGVGKEIVLSATVLGGPVAPAAVTWASADATKATVDAQGKVRGTAAGTTQIIATSGAGGPSDTVTITVVPVAPANAAIAFTEDDRERVRNAIQWENFVNQLQPSTRGALRAEARRADDTPTEPCTVSPTAQFRGVENQLYRVEIHRGGVAGTASFKWSRENASVVIPIQTITGATIKLREWWRDDRFGLARGDFVEVLDDDATLRQAAFPLCQVTDFDLDSMTVTLDSVPKVNTADPAKHPILRRWDHRGTTTPRGPNLGKLDDDDALLIDETKDTWIGLEDGVQVQFMANTAGPAHVYRTGDYWLIPARVNIADVVWRRDDAGAIAAGPHGVDHHYAPLAIIQVDGGGAAQRLFSLNRSVSRT